MGVFVVVPGRVEKGSPPIFFRNPQICGNLTTCVGSGILHCTVGAISVLWEQFLYCGNNFCTVGIISVLWE